MRKLFKYEIEFWLNEQYPTTIINDRYSGVYSGAKWLVFPYDLTDIDPAVCGSDPDCMNFWNKFEGFVGKGATIDDAVDNLLLKLKKEQEKLNY